MIILYIVYFVEKKSLTGAGEGGWRGRVRTLDTFNKILQP